MYIKKKRYKIHRAELNTAFQFLYTSSTSITGTVIMTFYSDILQAVTLRWRPYTPWPTWSRPCWVIMWPPRERPRSWPPRPPRLRSPPPHPPRPSTPVTPHNNPSIPMGRGSRFLSLIIIFNDKRLCKLFSVSHSLTNSLTSFLFPRIQHRNARWAYFTKYILSHAYYQFAVSWWPDYV